MKEDTEDTWKDCNCMNCRLARIEDNINKIKQFMDNLPTDFDKGPKEALS